MALQFKFDFFSEYTFTEYLRCISEVRLSVILMGKCGFKVQVNGFKYIWDLDIYVTSEVRLCGMV